MDDLGSDSDSSEGGRKRKGKRDHLWGKRESFKLQKGISKGNGLQDNAQANQTMFTRI